MIIIQDRLAYPGSIDNKTRKVVVWLGSFTADFVYRQDDDAMYVVGEMSKAIERVQRSVKAAGL